jgi:membrane-associated phospholipid phosphatase
MMSRTESFTQRLRRAADYNRGLWGPVRWAHVAWAAVRVPIQPILDWAGAPSRRTWAVPMLAGVLATLVLLPFDPALSRWAREMAPAGDARREIEALQQFGQGAMSVAIAAVIWLLDRANRRRLLDWLAGAVLTLAATVAVKSVLGRPRPFIDDPYYFTFLFGRYPVPEGEGFVLRSSWQGGYALASMPSRHAAFAALAGVFLATLYPRLSPLMFLLVAVVAAARVLTGAHYPSDVALGLTIGIIAGRLSCRGYWGVRALDWLWIRFVDRNATPAWPSLAAHDRSP